MTESRNGSALSLVVFVIEGQRYALPLHMVERVFLMAEVAPLPKAPAIALGVINLHGTIIPVLDIHRRFGFPPRDYGPVAHLVVARTSRRTMALPVGLVPITRITALCFIRRISLSMGSCMKEVAYAER